MHVFQKFILMTALTLPGLNLAGYEAPVPPFAPAAGEEGTTAVHLDDERIKGWALHVHSVSFGEDVSEEWRDPNSALGPPDTSGMNVTVLGRGGEIVLWFPEPINNGEGADFAVFENSFSGTFLELAFIEVSSDGEHFVRFPNYSLTAATVPGFGDIEPTHVHGYAGKYKAGYGVPFDLEELGVVNEAINTGYSVFSIEFREAFVENFRYVDLNNIQFVRVIDIPGDGSQEDCEGYPIYDPYKTLITAGFDMDGLAVLNGGVGAGVSFIEWSTAFSLDSDPGQDSDKDGWSQYLEYVFGTDPKDAGDAPEISLRLQSNGSLEISYWRRNAVEVIPDLQTSVNGNQWDVFENTSIDWSSTKRVDGALFVLETGIIPLAGDSLYLRFKLDSLRVN